MATTPKEMSTADGSWAYSPTFLGLIYDFYVLWFSCEYVWRCSAKNVLSPFFNRHITPATRRLLDIGVGTGYYLEKAPVSQDTEVVLFDLNENSLRFAQNRLLKAHPQVECKTIHGDVYDPNALTVQALGGKFDAISVMWLLHCLPGPQTRKTDFIIRLKEVLSPEGVLFLSTIIGPTADHNWFGRFLLDKYNKHKGFGNLGDTVDGFLDPLSKHFEVVEWKVVGTVLNVVLRHPM